MATRCGTPRTNKRRRVHVAGGRLGGGEGGVCNVVTRRNCSSEDPASSKTHDRTPMATKSSVPRHVTVMFRLRVIKRYGQRGVQQPTKKSKCHREEVTNTNTTDHPEKHKNNTGTANRATSKMILRLKQGSIQTSKRHMKINRKTHTTHITSFHLTKCTEAPLTTASTLTYTTSRKGTVAATPDAADDADDRRATLLLLAATAGDKARTSRSVKSSRTTSSGENCPDQSQCRTTPSLGDADDNGDGGDDDDDVAMRACNRRRLAPAPLEPNQPPLAPFSGQWKSS